MKIQHRITIWAAEHEKDEFLHAGVELKSGLQTFVIEESDPRWKSISILVQKFELADVPITKFTRAEIESSNFLKLGASRHYSYPEPSDDFGYLDKTYDLSDYCSTCGIGKTQSSSFFIRPPRKLVDKSVFQLNWIFDEFFVTKETWDHVFKPIGIQCLPVMSAASPKKTLATIVQLDIPARVELALDDFGFDVCSSCGRKKYHPVSRGFLPRPQETNQIIFRSTEYFGSGASANSLAFISRELFLRMRYFGLKGIHFSPCL